MGIACDVTISFAPTGDSLASLGFGWANAGVELTWSAGAESRLALSRIQDADAARPEEISGICDDRYLAAALSKLKLFRLAGDEKPAGNPLPSGRTQGLARLARPGTLTAETILNAEAA